MRGVVTYVRDRPRGPRRYLFAAALPAAKMFAMEGGGRLRLLPSVAALSPGGTAVAFGGFSSILTALMFLAGGSGAGKALGGSVAVGTFIAVAFLLSGRRREAQSPYFRRLTSIDRRRVMHSVHRGSTEIPPRLAPAVAEQATLVLSHVSRQRNSFARLAAVPALGVLAALLGTIDDPGRAALVSVLWLLIGVALFYLWRSERNLAASARRALKAAGVVDGQ